MDPQNAIDHLLQTIREDPADARSRLKLAELYAESRDFAKAIDAFESVGKIYAERGYVVKAVGAYKQLRELIASHAPELESRYAHVAPILAELFQRIGLTDDAAATLASMAAALERAGKVAEAIEALRRAVALDPTNALRTQRLAEAIARARPSQRPPPPPETTPVLPEDAGRTVEPVGTTAIRRDEPHAVRHAPLDAFAIPVVETTRLRLRGHRPEDLPACATMWADPAVVRHIGGKPFSVEEVWSKMLRYAGLWALLRFGYWLVEDRANGKFVGEVGFANFKRDLHPPLGDAPEIGWVLASTAHGLGLATEAVGAARAWGNVHLAAKESCCVIDPSNLASIRVAGKVGYRQSERATYKGSPILVFRG